MSKSLLKQNLFSLKNNAILHNRVILYFIFLLSLGNLFYLLVERDITTIVIFLVVGFLTSFFSKNMLIILFVAIVTANILKYGANIRHEGLESMVPDPEEVVADEDLEEAENADLTNADLTNAVSTVENYEDEEEADDEEVDETEPYSEKKKKQ